MKARNVQIARWWFDCHAYSSLKKLNLWKFVKLNQILFRSYKVLGWLRLGIFFDYLTFSVSKSLITSVLSRQLILTMRRQSWMSILLLLRCQKNINSSLTSGVWKRANALSHLLATSSWSYIALPKSSKLWCSSTFSSSNLWTDSTTSCPKSALFWKPLKPSLKRRRSLGFQSQPFKLCALTPLHNWHRVQ